MTLTQLIEIVETSDLADWHKLTEKTVNHWEENKPIQHSALLVYRNDIDITIAYGAPTNTAYCDPFLAKFPHGNDGHATQVAVALRYRGQVVSARSALFIDGARNLLLTPTYQAGKLVMPRSDLSFARLLFGSYEGNGYQTIEEALRVAELEIVEQLRR